MAADERADAIPDGRDETETERLDRNWNEILQELRVVQTGTQILTGFLLTLPFQQRFGDLDPIEIGIYLTLVSLAAVATLLALTPVALHRALFRQRARRFIVGVANRLLRASLLVIALTLTGTALLVFSVVVSLTAGIVAAAVVLVLSVVGWVALPLFARSRRPAG